MMPELYMCASIKFYHHVKPQSFHDIAVGMLGLDWENMGEAMLNMHVVIKLH